MLGDTCVCCGNTRQKDPSAGIDASISSRPEVKGRVNQGPETQS